MSGYVGFSIPIPIAIPNLKQTSNRLKQLVFLDAPLHQEMFLKTLKVAHLDVLRQAPREKVAMNLLFDIKRSLREPQPEHPALPIHKQTLMAGINPVKRGPAL